ncbi:hypothetical protein INR49_008158 [Caranx melampygus]|nr:hypothetical protein INR49_008158 [Caranx melampygus]
MWFSCSGSSWFRSSVRVVEAVLRALVPRLCLYFFIFCHRSFSVTSTGLGQHPHPTPLPPLNKVFLLVVDHRNRNFSKLRRGLVPSVFLIPLPVMD